MKNSRIQNVQPLEYNGIKYRSTLEADTAKTLSKLGIPFEYETKRITLVDGFHCPYQKDKVRAIHYTPDFTIGPIMLECKGFETPEWKQKKKLVFKYLMENEPETIFYQTRNSKSDIIKALDNHWSYLGYMIETTPTKKKGNTDCFDSIAQAVELLNLQGKPLGRIFNALTDSSKEAYGYKWKLKKIIL